LSFYNFIIKNIYNNHLINIMSRKLLMLISLFLSINYASSKNILKIPFKLYPSYELLKNQTQLLTKMHMSQIAVELSIGTPPKKFNCSINLNNFHSLFLEHDLSGIKFSSYYNKSSSESYNTIENKSIYFGEDFDRAEVFSDNIQILDENKKIIDNKFTLLLIDNLAYDVPNEFYTPGLIGLRINRSDEKKQVNENRFIYQIKKYGLADTETFFFEFNENGDKGYFVIGEDLFNNDNYLKINAGKIKISYYIEVVDWSFNFDKVYYGNKEIKYVENALIRTENGLIIGPYEYDKILSNYFLNEAKCNYSTALMGYATFKYYYCDENFDESKMEDLVFELRLIGYNFTLSPKDLFYKKNGKKYYKVLFTFYATQQYWYFNLDFLRKYKLRFDYDRKLIYIPIKNETKEEDNNNTSFSIFEQAYFWIIIFMGIFIIVLIAFIISYLKKYPRKKRANELNDDDYEYTRKTDDPNEIN